MDLFTQVFIELNLQRRLNSSGELFQAEFFYFTELLKEFGSLALNVPGYTITLADTSGHTDASAVWLKIRGQWSKFWIRRPASGAAVITDHL